MIEALVRAFLVETIVVLFGVMGVHSPSHGTRVFLPLTTDAEMVSWQARPVRAREPFLRNNEIPMLVIDGLLLFKTVSSPLLVIPIWLRVRVTRLVRRKSLLLACSYCVSVLAVAFVNWFASTCRSVTSQTVCTSTKMILTLGELIMASCSGTRVERSTVPARGAC